MPSVAIPFRHAGSPGTVPVLLSVPHAGRAYSPELLAAARVSRGALAVLEDPLVDRLIERAIAGGAAAIIAEAPRAEIDLNRSLDDLDPGMIAGGSAGLLSRRASVGLGLIPSRLTSHGPIWRRSLAATEVERRIATVHRPYHNAIGRALDQIRDRFGVAVLLDCHSMPTRGFEKPAIVLGDRNGTACDEWLVAAVEGACRVHAFAATRNEPYAGGEIVARHGRPGTGIHAVQIEIDRACYLAPNLRDPGPGFARTAALLASIAVAAAQAAMPLAQAAE